MKAALVTTKNGKTYVTLALHTQGDAVLLDYYRDAYDVQIMDVEDACNKTGTDLISFMKSNLYHANEDYNAMKEMYGGGLEVMAAKETLNSIKSFLEKKLA